MDADFEIAILQGSAMQRVVNVRASGWIHAADVQMTQILAVQQHLVGDLPRQSRQTLQHRRREGGWQKGTGEG